MTCSDGSERKKNLVRGDSVYGVRGVMGEEVE